MTGRHGKVLRAQTYFNGIDTAKSVMNGKLDIILIKG